MVETKNSKPVSDFETQVSELLPLLTQDQLQAARDLLLLLTGGADVDCAKKGGAV